eukprot:Nk52_evm6s323 gene=Nk52_evmTU6s323
MGHITEANNPTHVAAVAVHELLAAREVESGKQQRVEEMLRKEVEVLRDENKVLREENRRLRGDSDKAQEENKTLREENDKARENNEKKAAECEWNKSKENKVKSTWEIVHGIEKELLNKVQYAKDPMGLEGAEQELEMLHHVKAHIPCNSVALADQTLARLGQDEREAGGEVGSSDIINPPRCVSRTAEGEQGASSEVLPPLIIDTRLKEKRLRCEFGDDVPMVELSDVDDMNSLMQCNIANKKCIISPRVNTTEEKTIAAIWSFSECQKISPRISDWPFRPQLSPLRVGGQDYTYAKLNTQLKYCIAKTTLGHLTDNNEPSSRTGGEDYEGLFFYSGCAALLHSCVAHHYSSAGQTTGSITPIRPVVHHFQNTPPEIGSSAAIFPPKGPLYEEILKTCTLPQKANNVWLVSPK